ncbi:MAG: tetraacyldisaccharide 4'-kinase [Rickettsiales bacterium]|nr:tetraacyldisaccharide 4'-kinase [Rickettsiales bacterium]
MKTPSFWRRRGIISTLLLPAAILYEAIFISKRWLTKAQRVDVPVICVGNLTAGGAGKTPIALYIGDLLRPHAKVFFLSRGYGGTLSGPLLVDPSIHRAHDVGDEPLLLAGLLSTVVAKDRVSGARFAIKNGAEAIIMDDGFQHHRLHKDLSFVVIDDTIGFGNGRLLPAGPLREAPEDGFRRCQAAIIMNGASNSHWTPKSLLTFNAQTHTQLPLSKQQPIVAFCAIAYPEKFFAALTQLGYQLVGKHIFPDHYRYQQKDLDLLSKHAKELGAILVTTRKDAVKLPADFRSSITVADLRVQLEKKELLSAMLYRVLQS